MKVFKVLFFIILVANIVCIAAQLITEHQMHTGNLAAVCCMLGSMLINNEMGKKNGTN